MSEPTKTFTVEFNPQEAQALFNLLHLAVKAAGLEGPHAANAVHFQTKINKSFEEQNKPKSPFVPLVELGE